MLDDSNLIIEASARRWYHVSLRRRAFGLSSSWSIAFDSDSSRICARFSDLIIESPMGAMERDSIRIGSIRALNEEERETLLIEFGKMEPEVQQTPVPREIPGAEVEELDPAANDDTSSN